MTNQTQYPETRGGAIPAEQLFEVTQFAQRQPSPRSLWQKAWDRPTKNVTLMSGPKLLPYTQQNEWFNQLNEGAALHFLEHYILKIIPVCFVHQILQFHSEWFIIILHLQLRELLLVLGACSV